MRVIAVWAGLNASLFRSSCLYYRCVGSRRVVDPGGESCLHDSGESSSALMALERYHRNAGTLKSKTIFAGLHSVQYPEGRSDASESCAYHRGKR